MRHSSALARAGDMMSHHAVKVNKHRDTLYGHRIVWLVKTTTDSTQSHTHLLFLSHCVVSHPSHVLHNLPLHLLLMLPCFSKVFRSVHVHYKHNITHKRVTRTRTNWCRVHNEWVSRLTAYQLYSAIHNGSHWKIETRRQIKNTDNTETKHNPKNKQRKIQQNKTTRF